MEDTTMERRRLLRTVGMVAGATAAASGVGAAVAPADARGQDGQGGGHRLLGSWLVDVDNDDGSSLVSIGSFAAGGVAVTHDISPAGPPLTGTWDARGQRWRATLWGGFPGDEGPGSVGSTLQLRLRGWVGHDGIRGTFEFTFFDAGGAETASGGGTFKGRRIEA
jgi:hypothetical protein